MCYPVWLMWLKWIEISKPKSKCCLLCPAPMPSAPNDSESIFSWWKFSCGFEEIAIKCNLCQFRKHHFLESGLFFHPSNCRRWLIWNEVVIVLRSAFVACNSMLDNIYVYSIETYKLFKFLWIIHAAGIWKKPIDCIHQAIHGII